MFIKAQMKVRFGDIRNPFVNIDHIVSLEKGHEDNVNIKMANNDEFVVMGELAQKLMAYAEQNELK